MSKEIRIQPCYNGVVVVITKSMTLKEVFRALKRLEKREIDGVYLSKTAPD
jgi:hypothetical protein